MRSRVAKKVDLSGNECPLAEKCPYYKKVKDGAVTECPLGKKCPHFKEHHGGSGDARDCPYMQKKESLASSSSNEHDEL